MAAKIAKARLKKIETKSQYEAVMGKVHSMMRKGEKALTEKELKQLEAMAKAAEEFEDAHFPLPEPSTLEEMLELRMFQMKLNQTKAAQVLGIPNSKLSQILNGKRKPDAAFLKAAHKKLKIDAKFLLDKV